jgi:Uma2 family endonuclease
MQRARPGPTRFTYDDYVNFPEDGRRHELIDGEHFVTPSPDRRHQELSLRLVLALGSYLRDHRLGTCTTLPWT